MKSTPKTPSFRFGAGARDLAGCCRNRSEERGEEKEIGKKKKREKKKEKARSGGSQRACRYANVLVALNGVKFDSKNASYIIVPVRLVQPGFSTAPRAGELLWEPFEFYMCCLPTATRRFSVQFYHASVHSASDSDVTLT